MIPWPLALLTMVYGLLAFLSAVQVITCAAQHALAGGLWSLVWFLLTSASAVGLPSRYAWARRCAVLTALLFVISALVGATILVLRQPPQPRAALGETLLAGVALIVIRYLTRPPIKAQFH